MDTSEHIVQEEVIEEMVKSVEEFLKKAIDKYGPGTYFKCSSAE